MRLKELREEANLTQKQLAEEIGNVQRNISNWESGASEPDLETVIKLADFFSVTTDELLGIDAATRAKAGMAFRVSDHYLGEVYEGEFIKEVKSLNGAQKKYLLDFLQAMKK